MPTVETHPAGASSAEAQSARCISSPCSVPKALLPVSGYVSQPHGTGSAKQVNSGAALLTSRPTRMSESGGCNLFAGKRRALAEACASGRVFALDCRFVRKVAPSSAAASLSSCTPESRQRVLQRSCFAAERHGQLDQGSTTFAGAHCTGCRPRSLNTRCEIKLSMNCGCRYPDDRSGLTLQAIALPHRRLLSRP